MRKYVTLVLMIACTGLLSADVLHLRDGRTVDGKLISATSRQIRFLTEGQRTSRAYDLTTVDRISFGEATTTTSRPSDRIISSSERASATRSRASGVAVPAGSVVTVRMIDAVNSDNTNVGDTYRASMDEPLIVDGRTVAPKGADATVRIARVDQSGVITGREAIALVLNDITIDGRRYTAESEPAEVAAKSRSKESATIIGGTAVVGAIIGAIAGGGKGAAIGAASGAGAGAAVQGFAVRK